jgi:hypothetical protein
MEAPLSLQRERAGVRVATRSRMIAASITGDGDQAKSETPEAPEGASRRRVL